MKALERAKTLLKRALSERATPRGLALSVGLGVLLGTSPLLGLHALIAAALATAFRLNRALAVLGTNISFGPLMALQVAGEVIVGSRLLGQELPPITASNALDVAKGALGAWWVGYAVVGPSLAGLVGGLVYALARRREAREGPGAG